MSQADTQATESSSADSGTLTATPDQGAHALSEVPRESNPGGREDWFLWLIIVAILGFLASFFVGVHSSLVEFLNQSGQMDAQSMVAFGALLVASARTNAAFLVGAMLSFVGAMIVLRGVKSRVTGSVSGVKTWKAGLATDSPGVLLAVLGVIIIVVSVTKEHSVAVATATRPGVGKNVALERLRSKVRGAGPTKGPVTPADDNGG